MDENRRLRLALKVSEGRAQQLAWKNAELRNQVEKERRTRKLLSDIARFDTEAIEAITTSVQEIIEEAGCFASVRRKGGGEMSGTA